jgi:hypothetical protein
VAGPAGRHDGQLRFAVTEIPQGTLLVNLGSGRVELGRAAGQQVRVRWTFPAALMPAVPDWLRRREPGPRVSAGGDGLRISARRARLRIDVPDVLNVTVRLRRGQITSWGAGGRLALDCSRGRVVCRELVCPSLRAAGRYVNLHFAAPPEQAEVESRECVLALPPGPYAVTVPPGSEVEVAQTPDASHRITVTGGPARLLASQAPLSLRDEPADGERDGG